MADRGDRDLRVADVLRRQRRAKLPGDQREVFRAPEVTADQQVDLEEMGEVAEAVQLAQALLAAGQRAVRLGPGKRQQRRRRDRPLQVQVQFDLGKTSTNVVSPSTDGSGTSSGMVRLLRSVHRGAPAPAGAYGRRRAEWKSPRSRSSPYSGRRIASAVRLIMRHIVTVPGTSLVRARWPPTIAKALVARSRRSPPTRPERRTCRSEAPSRLTYWQFRSCCHPLGVAVGDEAAAAVGVLVLEDAVDHVGDGLEAAVGVPGRPLGLAGA